MRALLRNAGLLGALASACLGVSSREDGGRPALLITRVAASDVTQTSATIAWSLSEPASGQVEYGLTTAYGQLSAKEAHQLAGLAPGTEYHFRVRSAAADGREAVSTDATFTTLTASKCMATVSPWPWVHPPDVRYTAVTVPAAPRPGLLAPVAEPFGTQLVRITDGVRHSYSKVQAWNCNQTLIGIGGDSRVILDGRTYQPVRMLPYAASEVKWSHTDPNKLFGENGNSFLSVDATTGAATVLHTFTGYQHVYIGPWEGNVSADDRFVALVTVADGPDAEVIIYDLMNDSIVAQKTTAALGYAAGAVFDWVSMSQSGNYVVIVEKRGSVRSFDRALTLVATLGSVGEHGDLGFDTAGNEVFVQVGVSGRPARMTRLDNAQGTDLLQTGLGQAGHMSCRNVLRPGWCYLSMSSTHEVLALKLDGSQTVERFAFHRSSEATYEAQAQGVTSPDGTRVLFASDWNGTASIDAYVAGLPR